MTWREAILSKVRCEDNEDNISEGTKFPRKETAFGKKRPMLRNNCMPPKVSL